MSFFEYKGKEASKLVSDARDLMVYSYHGMENIPVDGFSAEEEARKQIEEKGWTVLTPDALDIPDAEVDRNGTFQGEIAKFKNAQADVLAKYDDAGKIVQMAFAIRGTTGTIDNIVTDTVGDVIDYIEFLGSEPNYTFEAFGNVLTAVKNLMQASGLTAEDLIVTGHSLGGGAVTNMAEQSDANKDSFFINANYIGFASHYTPEDGSSVLENGAEIFSFDFENDPVGSVFAEDQIHFFGNDKNYEYETNNLVLFNDLYPTPAFWDGGNVYNIATWSTHLPNGYSTAVDAILNSEFTGEMTRDSLVIVSYLTDLTRDKVWVQNIDPLFDSVDHFEDGGYILGSGKRDLLAGRQGDDALEGFAGNDHLKGRDGDDRLFGGFGDDLLEGGAGNDLLQDGSGSDTLVGGQGADIFVMSADGTNDEIRDFEVGVDKIDLRASGVSAFDQLLISANGWWQDVQVAYSDDVLRLDTGLWPDLPALSASDFIFV